MRHASLHLRLLPALLLLCAAAPGARAADPLATADAETPGVRVEILDLKRDSGGTLTLRVVMINETGRAFGENCAFREDGLDCETFSAVHLLDVANKRKYQTVRDENRKCSCSVAVKGVPANGRINLWAKLAAPPENVEKITVVIPRFMPMDDVPIRK